jgi:hypothetical protein
MSKHSAVSGGLNSWQNLPASVPRNRIGSVKIFITYSTVLWDNAILMGLRPLIGRF